MDKNMFMDWLVNKNKIQITNLYLVINNNKVIKCIASDVHEDKIDLIKEYSKYLDIQRELGYVW